MIRKNNVTLKNLLSLIENSVNKSYFKFKTHYIHYFQLFLILVFNLVIICKFKNLTIYLRIAIN